MERKGSAEWSGDLKTGSGRLTIGEGSWTGGYSFASRFQDGAGTNPEELIAAAHAACFSMGLCYLLGEQGLTPRSIRVAARVQLRPVEGLPTIDQIELLAEGEVPGLSPERLSALAEQAKQTCAVSRALAGVRTITVSARLI